MSNSLRSHRLQHARLPCPSSTPGACSNSCPSSQWCHPIISTSVVPFSSCLQSFPASGSFPMSQFFTSGGQNIGTSAFTISPSNEYSGLMSFRMDWLDILEVQGNLKSTVQKFSNESVLHIRRPKYWSFSFSISISNEYLGLVCFRMNWLDLLAVQETLKSLLQYHSSKASILCTQLS